MAPWRHASRSDAPSPAAMQQQCHQANNAVPLATSADTYTGALPACSWGSRQTARRRPRPKAPLSRALPRFRTRNTAGFPKGLAAARLSNIECRACYQRSRPHQFCWQCLPPQALLKNSVHREVHYTALLHSPPKRFELGYPRETRAPQQNLSQHPSLGNRPLQRRQFGVRARFR